MSSNQIVCYVPVLHSGYLDFFNKHPGAEIKILGRSVVDHCLDYSRKDIRALSANDAAALLGGLGRKASVVELEDIETIFGAAVTYMPDDDISRALADDFGLNEMRLEPVFLRWDRKAVDVNLEITPDRYVSLSPSSPIIKALQSEADSSTNWWRNVGTVLVSGGKVVMQTHNSSVPSEYSSAIDGDPRITTKRGVDIETSIDMHAEARLIAEAAKTGTSLEGKEIYVSTFPCPTCAKLIAYSGLSSCYYVDGYATLDGQTILKAEGVEIVKISTALHSSPRQRAKKYS